MSRTRKHQKVKVAVEYRKEPDVRRLARAIIRLSLEAGDDQLAEVVDQVDQQLADLEAEEAVRRRKRHGSSGSSSSPASAAADLSEKRESAERGRAR